MRRRQFVALSLAGGAGTALAGGAGPLLGANAGTAGSGRRQSLRLLVLGGTNFVGPPIVEHALAAGHEVTLFNRGLTRPELFPDVERLIGDRRAEGGLAALEGSRRWDAVIDVWPQESVLVEEAARLLRDRVEYHFFVSSIAVYRDFSHVGLDEESATQLDAPGTYGGEKAIAERTAAQLFEGRAGAARCHAILGPGDPGSAYHYWLRRLATRPRVLAPGPGIDPVQVVDVRDVGDWVMHSVEEGLAGPYNLCGQMPPMSLRHLLETTRSAIGSEAELVWADPDVLRGRFSVQSFTDLPLWAPLDEDEGFYQIDGSRAIDAGARFRPVADTARAAWEWFDSRAFANSTFPIDGFGLPLDREDAVLEALGHGSPG